MKLKKIAQLILVSAFISGCSGTADSGIVSGSDDGYESYAENVRNMVSEENYTAAVRSSYSFSYSDESTDLYSMDGVLSIMNESDHPTAHITQHISSNGMNSDLDGYYYDGRLYNTYNNISYYEDMDTASLKETLLFPLKPYLYPESMVDSVTEETDGNGNLVYRIHLNNTSAGDIFSDRYDTYGFKEYDDYQVSDNTITDTFSSDGHFKKEEASFTCSISYSGQTVNVNYTGSVEYADGVTTVEISDEEREKDAGYIAYNEIDPSSISAETEDDSAEDTVSGTFRKRLVNRLGYEETEGGILRDTFNTDMVYMVDFNSCTFEYVNYSIAYVYNWKTDTGAMNACSYDFKTGNATSSCQDSTVDTIRDVKNYLQMELYYCGLSLEDLQNEADS